MIKLSHAKVLEYLNQARTNPQSLIPHIQGQLSKFKDNSKYEIMPNFCMRTHEGKAVWHETVKFLKTQKPIKKLQNHKGLGHSAQDHAEDLGKHNMMGHVGSNGSEVNERIQRHSKYNIGSIGQNVAQQIKNGNRNHQLQSVVSLIIDDGVPDRGHRESIFSPDFNFAGIGISETDNHYLVVVNYASNNLTLKSENEKKQAGLKNNVNKQNVEPKKVVAPKGDTKRHLVSTSVNTSTTQSGNKKKVTKTTVKHYSDGSEEKQISVQECCV